MKRKIRIIALIIGALSSLSLIVISCVNMQHLRNEAIFFKHGEEIRLSQYPEIEMRYGKRSLEKMGYENIKIELELKPDNTVSLITMSATKDFEIPIISGDITHKYVGKSGDK